MLKLGLEDSIASLLEEQGYVTCRYHGCFDIAARKRRLLLLKILLNIDSFLEGQARNLGIISRNLEGSPLLIGTQTRRERLKDGVVYERFGVPAVNPETFKRLIEEEILPTVYRDRGGTYVSIDTEALKEARGRKGLTQRELAEMVGINKKVIYEHEKKQLRMMLNIAEKLEKILEKRLIKGIDPLKAETRGEAGEPKDRFEREIGRELGSKGFKIDYVKSAPFDLFAKERAMILSDVEASERMLSRRAPKLGKFIKVTGRPALLITEKAKEESYEGIPMIRREELREMETSREVIKIAKKTRKLK